MAQLTLKQTVPSPLLLRDMLEEMAVKELQGPAQGDEEEVSERIRDRYLVGILAPRQRALVSTQLPVFCNLFCCKRLGSFQWRRLPCQFQRHHG